MNDVASPRAFLVLKLPRTGSTMLGHVLTSHPAIRCTGEFLNAHQQEPREAKIAALTDFYRAVPGPPITALGQTMNPFKYGLRPRDLRAAFEARGIGSPPALLLVLRRENVLKQAVSAFIASEGRWESSRKQIDDPDRLASRTLPIDELSAKVEEMTDRSRRLDDFAAELGGPRLDITYEDLLSDPGRVVNAVFSFLEVGEPPAGFDPVGGYQKVLSDDLRDVVANYDEMAAVPELAAYL